MESWCQESGEVYFCKHFGKKGGNITQATDELFNPSQAVTKPGAVSSAAVQPSLVIT